MILGSSAISSAGCSSPGAKRRSDTDVAAVETIEKLIPLQPAVVVPGHGPASRDVGRDLALTRDYLAYLRETMGRAAGNLEGFDEAYARTDWSRFASLPAFEPANRINAYGTYLRMEQEALDGAKP